VPADEQPEPEAWTGPQLTNKRGVKLCDVRYTNAAVWRAKLLQMVREGVPVMEGCRRLNVKKGAYQMARKMHPDWAAELSAARQGNYYAATQVRDKLENPEVRETLDADTKLDLYAKWVSHYLRMSHQPQQLRIADALDNTQPGEITMCLLWPEAGKSTSVLNRCTHRLSLNPNERICLVSESQDLTRKFVGRLKNRLTDNAQFPELISAYGPFMEDGQSREGKPWAADFFRVARCAHDEADYSVQARAWSSAAYGSRIDTLIIDDVQSRRSLSQTETIYANLRQTYFTRGKEMRVVIVGTRVGGGDIYERIIDDELVDNLIQLPAMNHEGEPTVPEAWALGRNKTPKEHLEAMRKRVGELAWFASYQQNPRADEFSTFAAYLDKALDHDRSWGEIGKWAVA